MFIMKLPHLITHPLFLILCFLCILIDGEKIGGFYFFYILLGLIHGGIYAMLAIFGIGLLLFNYAKYTDAVKHPIRAVLNIGGVVLLFASLFSFFYQDMGHYNYQTFYDSVSLSVFYFFLLIALLFLIKNFLSLVSGIIKCRRF